MLIIILLRGKKIELSTFGSFLVALNERKKEAEIKEDYMSWALFAQLTLLIVIFAVVMTFVKCMHDTHCTACKKEEPKC